MKLLIQEDDGTTVEISPDKGWEIETTWLNGADDAGRVSYQVYTLVAHRIAQPCPVPIRASDLGRSDELRNAIPPSWAGSVAGG